MIQAQDLAGLTVATVLPFDAQGGIDWPSFERLLEYCALPDHTRAVFVNGHAGEGAALSAAERREVITRARVVIGRAKPLLAGVIAGNLADAMDQARAAEAAGADCIVLFPPEALGGGAGATPDGPLLWFEAITGAVSIPASVFQYPVASGLGYSTETLVALAGLDRVIAVKEGSGCMRAFEENLRRLRSTNVTVLASNFHWFLPQLALGAGGLISGLGSLAPAWLADLCAASAAGDLPGMRAANDRLNPLIRAIYGPAPILDMHSRIKLGLQRLGVIENARPRPPLVPVRSPVAEPILAAVQALSPPPLPPPR